MNAAARMLNQGNLTKSLALSFVLARAQVTTIILGLSLLTTALSIVYVTNVTRSLNADLQQTLLERNAMHVKWGQLLLQKGSALMQAKVQQTAEEKLNMVIPDGKTVVIVKRNVR